MTRVYDVIRAEGNVIENGKSTHTVRWETLVIPEGADPVTEALRQMPELRRCSRIRTEIIGRKVVTEIASWKSRTAEELQEAGRANARNDTWHDTGRRRREFDFGTRDQVKRGLERWGDVPAFGPGRGEDAEKN